MSNDTKNSLVIGSSGDIGFACAKTLAPQYHLLLHSHQNPQKLDHLAQNFPHGFEQFTADITQPEDIAKLMKEIMVQHGQINSLIIASGIGIEPAAWDTIDATIFNQTININLTGVFNCMQAVAPLMMKHREGSIVLIGSTASLTGSVDCIAYSAAKAGIVNIAKAFAKKLATYQINVNVVSPTWTNTKWHHHKPKSFHSMVNSMIPMGKMVEPNQVAETVAFLVNPINRMITGQNIVIDGGLNL